MPIHDWTRVSAGTWHDFHVAWIAELRNVLNDGLLPADYYARAEQIAGPLGPDVLTLQETQETESHGVSWSEKTSSPGRTRRYLTALGLCVTIDQVFGSRSAGWHGQRGVPAAGP